MSQLFAQGDILIERVELAPVSGQLVPTAHDGIVVIAEGEVTGHLHKLIGEITFYRDDALARDIPSNLYVGHVRVSGPSARLEHDEHAPIDLNPGTYRVRRQRQLDPSDLDMFGD